MIPSTLFAFVAILSSFAAVNGAVAQRAGTFTSTTPLPTSAGKPVSTTTNSTTGVPTTSSLSIASTPSTTLSHTGTANSSTSVPPHTSGNVTSTPSSFVPPPTTASNTSTIFVTTTQTKTPPVVTTTTSPAPAPTGAANCNGVQQWQAAFAYVAGDKVIFNGELFTAKQWTYNNAPPTHPDQWVADGTCSQPINNQANCQGVSAWQSNIAYVAGDKVTFDGHLWSAVQWTITNSPGDASGSWKDLGACA